MNLETIKTVDDAVIAVRDYIARRGYEPSSIQTFGNLDVLVYKNVPMWNPKNINWQKDGF